MSFVSFPKLKKISNLIQFSRFIYWCIFNHRNVDFWKEMTAKTEFCKQKGTNWVEKSYWKILGILLKIVTAFKSKFFIYWHWTRNTFYIELEALFSTLILNLLEALFSTLTLNLLEALFRTLKLNLLFALFRTYWKHFLEYWNWTYY